MIYGTLTSTSKYKVLFYFLNELFFSEVGFQKRHNWNFMSYQYLLPGDKNLAAHMVVFSDQPSQCLAQTMSKFFSNYLTLPSNPGTVKMVAHLEEKYTLPKNIF